MVCFVGLHFICSEGRSELGCSYLQLTFCGNVFLFAAIVGHHDGFLFRVASSAVDVVLTVNNLVGQECTSRQRVSHWWCFLH